MAQAKEPRALDFTTWPCNDCARNGPHGCSAQQINHHDRFNDTCYQLEANQQSLIVDHITTAIPNCECKVPDLPKTMRANWGNSAPLWLDRLFRQRSCIRLRKQRAQLQAHSCERTHFVQDHLPGELGSIDMELLKMAMADRRYGRRCRQRQLGGHRITVVTASSLSVLLIGKGILLAVNSTRNTSGLPILITRLDRKE
jgi:hypothetical protein